jgi:regulatory protein|tara:strand:- start:400 stop:837 length:438 start_codon:yes stop_codon:yes gene_type:complete
MTAQSLTARAVNLLARREHSQEELRTKLRKAEFEIDEINVAIQKLAKIDLQSDLRFAENYLHYRSQRGFGSQKIKFELNERGVDKQTINAVFEQEDIDWFFLAVLARNKRFGQKAPDDLKDRAKQQRFLQYRGFTHEQINESFNI